MPCPVDQNPTIELRVFQRTLHAFRAGSSLLCLPIIDPYSKQILGVIDLSTHWQKHNSLGLLAAERCASIIQSALLESQNSVYIFVPFLYLR